MLRLKGNGGGMKYRKMGSLEKSGDGSFLVDGEGKSRKADDMTVIVWSMCDGITSHDDIIRDISSHTKAREAEVEKAVMRTIARLERFGLLRRM